uniref:Uncharacterized protein n=1 Tax=Pyxicephalus adspersus TaxID=30357 RepID=A0AAV3A482_PYXAD|nr:TPA: hypothetical protein GDO54_010158 [Pyxicephalus adspersus]
MKDDSCLITLGLVPDEILTCVQHSSNVVHGSILADPRTIVIQVKGREHSGVLLHRSPLFIEQNSAVCTALIHSSFSLFVIEKYCERSFQQQLSSLCTQPYTLSLYKASTFVAVYTE